MPALGRWLAGLGLVAVLLGTAGCGSGGRPTGQITWKGKGAGPGNGLIGAEIRFAPKADPDAVFFGMSGAGGVYILDYGRRGGIPVGPCKVTIAYTTLRNGKALPEGEQGAALRGDADRVTRHEFEFDRDIGPGGSTLDFELSEGRKVGP